MYSNYESPFGTRYASEEMQYLFSADKKFKTWRKLWIALAKAEHRLGLPITEEQIDELEAHKDDINYEVARGTGKAHPPRRDEPRVRLRRRSAPRPRESSTWEPLPAMWETIPT